MCLAARDRPFTEKADGHEVEFLILGRESEACGKGNMAPDNGIAAHESARGIHQVHGAPFALAQARRFAEQLGHHVAGVGASGETVPMVAVRADRVVIRSKRGDGPDRNGLFADIEVQETGNFCESVHFRRFFFEPTDQQHLTIEE